MKKSKWKYFYSDKIKMRYAVNSQTGEMMTEDQVTYSVEEINLLKKSAPIELIHPLKKIFNGTLVEGE